LYPAIPEELGWLRVAERHPDKGKSEKTCVATVVSTEKVLSREVDMGVEGFKLLGTAPRAGGKPGEVEKRVLANLRNAKKITTIRTLIEAGKPNGKSRHILDMNEKLKHFFTRNQTLAPVTRWGWHTFNILARHNPAQKFSKRVRTLRYLNIGCGKKPKPHTINLNYEWYPFVDLAWDITKPLPIADGSLKGIYTEHVLEHLPFHVMPSILEDWFRVLEPAGTLRILVPDAELYLKTYVEIKSGKAGMFPYHDLNNTPMMHVNRVFRNYEHLFAYDFETFERVLKQVGFSDIARKNHNEGLDKNLLIDSDERECESLRIECVKIK
jgi:predicted SAM-dependent methyltransferase